MNGKIVGIIAAIIVIGGGWYMLKGTPASTPTAPATETSVKPAEGVTETPAPAAVTVVYSNQGFSPKSVTVPLGTTVTFVNQSTNGMWVASAKHPSHTVYSGTGVNEHCPDTAGTAFDECSAAKTGESYSFTFMKEGTWGYHNHVQAADFGSVTVTAVTPTGRQ